MAPRRPAAPGARARRALRLQPDHRPPRPRRPGPRAAPRADAAAGARSSPAPPIDLDLDGSMSFTEEVQRLRPRPGDPRRRRAHRRRADAAVAEALEIATGAPVSTSNGSGWPTASRSCWSRSSCPRRGFPGLLAGDLEGGSLYELLASATTPASSAPGSRSSRSPCRTREAQLLGVEPHRPALLIEGLAYDRRRDGRSSSPAPSSGATGRATTWSGSSSAPAPDPTTSMPAPRAPRPRRSADKPRVRRRSAARVRRRSRCEPPEPSPPSPCWRWSPERAAAVRRPPPRRSGAAPRRHPRPPPRRPARPTAPPRPPTPRSRSAGRRPRPARPRSAGTAASAAATRRSRSTVEKQVVEKFNASHPDIHLTFEAVPYAGANDALATEIASGNGPDIVGPVGIGGANAFHGQWLDLAPLIAEDQLRPVGLPAGRGRHLQARRGPGRHPVRDLSVGPVLPKSLFEEAGLA